MKQDTVNKIIEINREFYQTFAGHFAATRQRLQPGVQKILSTLPQTGKIIDIGCGNGELWQTLKRTNFQGSYLGLDFSSNLLETALRDGSDQALAESAAEATHDLANSLHRGVFLQADFASGDWDLGLPEKSFDIVFSFAVLHHIPGNLLREKILNKIQRLLKPDGLFYHSNWQFLNSPKLKSRIQPWQAARINESEVDAGDYLLDWRAGGIGLRYVHQFDESELSTLANTCRFQILDVFYSDGEGANLSLYQTWRKNSP